MVVILLDCARLEMCEKSSQVFLYSEEGPTGADYLSSESPSIFRIYLEGQCRSAWRVRGLSK